MGLHRDSAHRLDQLLRNVTAVTPLDDGIGRLRAQLNAFQSTAGRPPVLDRLAQAVIAGDTDAQPLLWSAALAEQQATPAGATEIVAGVRQRIHAAIRQHYNLTADQTYGKVAALFDAAARQFTDAHHAIDCEAPAELVVDLPDKARKLWRQEPELAADLDRLAVALHACGVLAGRCEDTDDGTIELTVDVGDCDRATIKDCWDIREAEKRAARNAAAAGPFTGRPEATHSRTGRWGALLKAGATIRAAQPATVDA